MIILAQAKSDNIKLQFLYSKRDVWKVIAAYKLTNDYIKRYFNNI